MNFNISLLQKLKSSETNYEKTFFYRYTCIFVVYFDLNSLFDKTLC